MYVCQHCGTKYSVEEAKKMMVEIDNSKKLANLYERARKSIEVDDLEHAAEYYKEILDENPNDWEAYFYSYLGEHTSYTNAQASSVAAKLANTIPSAYDMAIETDNADEIAKRLKIISSETATRLTYIAATGSVLLKDYEKSSVLTIEGKVKRDLFQQLFPTAANIVANCVVAFDPLIEKVEELYKNEKISEEVYKENLLLMLRVKFNIANMDCYPVEGVSSKFVKNEVIKSCAEKIKVLDSDFEMPKLEDETSSGGCYVATAVYGSYDCPEVWTLRRFRDFTLAKSFFGRLFIRTYYAISPTLVKWFGETKWFKNLWKPTLDKMVARLNEKGVENTPYDDIVW